MLKSCNVYLYVLIDFSLYRGDKRKFQMKKYSFFDYLYLSFYSRSFYQEIGKKRKGLCLGYLFFILCLFWIPEISRIHSEVSDFISAESFKYVKQVPVITISKGRATIKEPTPFYINDTANDKPFAIIDTSGQITSLDKTTAYLLLTNTKLIIKNYPFNTRAFDLQGIENLTIDQKVLQQWIEDFNMLFPFILFPFVILFSFFFHIIQVLLAAGFGRLFANTIQVNIDFRSLVRLAVVSFTPAIMLQTAHAILDIPFPYRTLIAFVISLCYVRLHP